MVELMVTMLLLTLWSPLRLSEVEALVCRCFVTGASNGLDRAVCEGCMPGALVSAKAGPDSVCDSDKVFKGASRSTGGSAIWLSLLILVLFMPRVAKSISSASDIILS